MTFYEVYDLILASCPFLSGNVYDGIIVKKLAATNTISDTGSSHQSHMAFTGKQKDFFPFLDADGYFNINYDNKDDDLKKYFTLRVPLNIYAENVKTLSDDKSPIKFDSEKKIVRASVLRSRRKDQEDQVEVSIKSLDDKDFIEFRKLLRVNDLFILLKKQNVLEYDLVGISSSDKNAAALTTCTDFYKQATQTPVDINNFENDNFISRTLLYPLVEESFLNGLNKEGQERLLGDKLNEEKQTKQTHAVQYFGFKYSKILEKFDLSILNILRYAGAEDSLNTEVTKGRGIFRNAEADGLLVEKVKSKESDFTDLLKKIEKEVKNSPERIEDLKKLLFQSTLTESQVDCGQTISPITPTQIIYYGVPGCGKSHQIQKDLKTKGITEENHQQKRVVFHPDYCNADFVGQILPVTKRDGGIRYQFKAGPFTKILREAYQNPTKEYALIIEEINRGNAAAIFGDLFQLLDRKKENDPIETVNGNSYGPGWSDYCIENDYINAYFRGAYDSEDIPNPLPPKKLGNITFNDNVDIRLPPNLSLYATMNTSDQNVFTLDNAFQRRWEMKQISNDLAHVDPAADSTKQYDEIIGNTNVKWGVFRDEINKIIMQSAEENGLSSMEDKRLGGWFITPKKDPNATEDEAPKITNEAFAEKVLKYLWDDAFKFDRSKHFGEIKTLEDLTKKFNTEGFKVFKDEPISNLMP